jgi:hypothetical protein
MKLSHENIKLIEEWLCKNKLEPDLSDDFVRKTYDEVLENLYKIKDVISVKKRKHYYTLQYDFVRRDLLKILYKQNNNSVKNIKAGYVYAIGNPAWSDYIKIGSTIDIVDRLRTYQTSSPFRDYYIIDYFFSMDRLTDESNLHNTFNDRNLEWCKIDIPTISKTFKEKREERHIEVLSDKLNFIKNKIKEANDLAQKIREEQAANKRKKQQNIRRSIRAKK